MNNTAFIFPGQASQYVGMGRDLFESSAAVRELYGAASRILEYDLAKICFEGPVEKLTETVYTQPAILVHSLAVLLELGYRDNPPAFVAGHSLGEYSALACAGVLSFEDAIFAVRERSRLMQSACQAADGTMAALLGCEGEDLEGLLKEAGQEGVIQAANFNSLGQVAISGERPAVEKAVGTAKTFNARKAILLTVGGAFHSPLMQPAQIGLQRVLASVKFNQAEIPVIANVTARPVSAAEDIRRLLVEQITAPVLWRQTIEYLYSRKVTRFIEIGPGKVLSGLVKRTLKDVQIEGIDTVEELHGYLETVGIG